MKTLRTISLRLRVQLALFVVAALSCLLSFALAVLLNIKTIDEVERDNIRSAESYLVSVGFFELLSKNQSLDLDPEIPKKLQLAELSELVQIYQAPDQLLYSNFKTRRIPALEKIIRSHVDRGLFILKIPFARGSQEAQERSYLAQVRSYRSTNKTFWFLIAARRPTLFSVARESLIPFLSVFTILMALSFLASIFIARRSLKPLHELAAYLDSLHFDKIKRWDRVSLERIPQDFAIMATRINELVLRAQSSYIRLHDLSHYLAHEIRTPLTIIRGEIETELMRQGEDHPHMTVLSSALEEVSRIENIVSTVLRLSRTQRGAEAYRPVPVALQAWLQKNLPILEKDSHLKIEYNGPEKSLPTVFLDPELLQLLLSNLFRNIRAHVGAEARAEFRAYQQGPIVVLEVSDNGPGLTEAQLLDVNQVEIAGEEIGLGLSLCKEISRVGYLPIHFENKSPKGLRVTIKCPIQN